MIQKKKWEKLNKKDKIVVFVQVICLVSVNHLFLRFGYKDKFHQIVIKKIDILYSRIN